MTDMWIYSPPRWGSDSYLISVIGLICDIPQIFYKQLLGERSLLWCDIKNFSCGSDASYQKMSNLSFIPKSPLRLQTCNQCEWRLLNHPWKIFKQIHPSALSYLDHCQMMTHYYGPDSDCCFVAIRMTKLKNAANCVLPKHNQ